MLWVIAIWRGPRPRNGRRGHNSPLPILWKCCAQLSLTPRQKLKIQIYWRETPFVPAHILTQSSAPPLRPDIPFLQGNNGYYPGDDIVTVITAEAPLARANVPGKNSSQQNFKYWTKEKTVSFPDMTVRAFFSRIAQSSNLIWVPNETLCLSERKTCSKLGVEHFTPPSIFGLLNSPLRTISFALSRFDITRMKMRLLFVGNRGKYQVSLIVFRFCSEIWAKSRISCYTFAT